MIMMMLPFILIWIGVVTNMPVYYYALIGGITVFDISMAFVERNNNGNDNGAERKKDQF